MSVRKKARLSSQASLRRYEEWLKEGKGYVPPPTVHSRPSQRVLTMGFGARRGPFHTTLATARRILADGNCDLAREYATRVQRLAKKPKEIEASARLQRGLQRCFLKQFPEE